MKFDMTKPCDSCPFLADCLKGWLGKSRATEIANGILADATFACHKTTEFDDDGEHRRSEGEQHCAGALILLEKLGRPNQMMRWMERLGFYDRRKLNMAAPVFGTPAAFVAHHAEGKAAKRRRRGADRG